MIALANHEPEAIRQWLRDLIAQTGLSANQLGVMAGIAPSTVTRFLNQNSGHRYSLSATSIRKIAQVAERRAPAAADADGAALREALQDFMRKRDLTVNGWCAAAGLSEGTLRNFLAGASATMTYQSLVALARAENVSLFDMLGEKAPGEDFAAVIARCIDEIRRLPAADRARAAACIASIFAVRQ